MKVKVLFFGATAEAAGQREIEFELEKDIKAAGALAEILSAFPTLRNFDKSLLFAVNQEYAQGDEFVREGDELAVFTPVSGG